MTDKKDKKKKDDAQAAEVQPKCGVRLGDARREKKIPILDIAKELHLDEYKVRALEENEFDVLGAPVFAKGHLRKYAQLLGLDDADIVSEFDALSGTMEAPQFISLRKRPQREMSPMPWVLVIAALVVIAALYWWFAMREPTTSDSVNAASDSVLPVDDAEVSNPTDTDDAVETELNLPSNNTDSAEQAEDQEPAQVVATPPEQNVPEQPMDSDELRITLSFSGACWTEISDADGRRLFFGLGESGREVSLTGKAPVNVLFGNAVNVTMTVNGEARPLENVDRRGTSRMTLSST